MEILAFIYFLVTIANLHIILFIGFYFSLQGICLNFDEQIDLFNLTVELELFKHYKASSKVSDYLSKSLFIITIGSNDYLNYAQPQLFYAKRRYDPQSFAKLLIDNLTLQFQVINNPLPPP